VTKVLQVKPGYSAVPLPDGNLYNAGQRITLSDAQYAQIPPLINKQLTVVISTKDSDKIPVPIVDSFTTNLLRSLLDNQQVPVCLTWNGSDYQPQQLKSSSRVKMFIGPNDPSTVTGVTLGSFDQWIDTSS